MAAYHYALGIRKPVRAIHFVDEFRRPHPGLLQRNYSMMHFLVADDGEPEF